jgi:outer membrane biosynthesis protein TonB
MKGFRDVIVAVALSGAVGAAVVVSAFAGGSKADPSLVAAPAAAPTPVICPGSTSTPTPTDTPTGTPTNTPTDTPTGTPTNTPTDTPTPTPTNTPTNTPTDTPTPTPTNTPTDTPTPTPTNTPTNTPTDTPTPTPTNTPTDTPTPTVVGFRPQSSARVRSAVNGAMATGRGTVMACGIATFEFDIRHKTQNGQVKPGLRGHLVYSDGADGLKKLRSTKYTSFVVTGNTATFGGECELKGGEPCTFEVYIEDNPSGTPDVFQISINGGPFMGGPLQSGKIKINGNS